MKQKKIYIVEDDPIIASDLKAILADLGYFVCGVSHQPFEAKRKIEAERPELILMDVNLNSEIDGIDLATLVKSFGGGIVFITAFTDKTTRDRVKPLHPLGYIIKPFDEKEIEVAIDLAMDRLVNPENETPAPADTEGTIFVRTGNNTSRKLHLQEILYMEACDNYAFIHTENERIMVSFTLKDLDQKIRAPFLVRVHRSFIVNTNRVEGIRNNALLVGKQEIPIGKSYKEEILRLFPTL